MMRTDRIKHLPLMFLAGAAMPSLALAQAIVPADGAQSSVSAELMGDIVVTAQRRSESAQRVGIAINAYSGELIKNLGLTSSTDIAKLSPGVSATGAQGGFLQTFSIRGVTQNDYNPHQESPVAAYQDEVYISSVQGQAFSIFDSERVEVLKGPQGTLFGRNATGGLVHYLTKKPTFDTQGYVDAKYGSFNLRQVEAGVGGPLSEVVAVRVAGLYSAHDPILKNDAGPDQWDNRSYAARAHILIQPNPDFSALFSGRYGRISNTISTAQQYMSAIAVVDSNGNQIDEVRASPTNTAQVITSAGPVGARPVPGGDFFGYRDPDGPGSHTSDQLVGKADANNPFAGDRSFSTAYGITGRLEGHTGDITLTSIADFSHFRWRVGASLLGGTVLPFGFDTIAKGIKQISEEFRVSGDHDRFRWTLGGYYLAVDGDYGAAFGFLPGGVGGIPADEIFTYAQSTESISGFGQAEFDILSNLTAIGGIRYIKEHKTFDFSADLVGQNHTQLANISTFDQATSPDADDSRHLVAWKLGLNYKPNTDLLFYATVNRGVKAGGFNAPTAPGAQVPFTFRPERLTAFETGFKSSLIGRRLTLNGSAYYYDYKDYQAYRGIGFTNFLVNADARTYGAELELSASPIERLNLRLAAAYTNALIKDVDLAPASVEYPTGFVADRRPAFSPKVQFSGLIRYALPLSFGTLAAQIDGSYQSSDYTQITNYRSLRNGGFALANARLTLASEGDKGWRLTAAVLNLTDHRYLVSGFATALNFGQDPVSYNKPRTFEVGARYDF